MSALEPAKPAISSSLSLRFSSATEASHSAATQPSVVLCRRRTCSALSGRRRWRVKSLASSAEKRSSSGAISTSWPRARRRAMPIDGTVRVPTISCAPEGRLSISWVTKADTAGLRMFSHSSRNSTNGPAWAETRSRIDTASSEPLRSSRGPARGRVVSSGCSASSR